MDDATPQLGTYAFAAFRLDPLRRTLTHQGQPVVIAGRLFDTLLYLVRNPGRVVDRGELAAALWPGRVIDDANVAKAISSLRSVLGQGNGRGGLIATVSGRGYQFSAPVVFEVHVEDGANASRPATAKVREMRQAATHPDRARATPPPRSARRALSLISAAAVVCLALLLWTLLTARSGPSPDTFSPPPGSVGVLPFRSQDSEDDWFADGVTDDIISALGRIGELRVAGGLSSFSLKGSRAPLRDSARALNVEAVLEGTVRRDGGRQVISAQLVNALTGYQMWSETFVGSQTDLPSMEQRITHGVLATLKVVTTRSDGLLDAGGTTDPAAFDAYLNGMSSLVAGAEDVNHAAIAALSHAILLDPHYARAYAARARARIGQWATTSYDSPDEAHNLPGLARQDGEKAVSLAPDLGAAHAALAVVFRFSLSNWNAALLESQRAVALSPGDAGILMDYAVIQLDLAHLDEAVDAAEHAASLDPLTPVIYEKLSRILAFAGRYDEATTALGRAARLGASASVNDRYLIVLLELQGQAESAVRVCAGKTGYVCLEALAWAYNKLGRQAEAEQALAALQAKGGDAVAYNEARILAQWGRQQEALSFLRKAYDLHDTGLHNLKIDPFLKPLRNTQTYSEIESKLQFATN